MTTENENEELEVELEEELEEEVEQTDDEIAAAEAAELIDAVGAAVDEATPDDILEANKKTVEVDEGTEQTPEQITAAAEAAEAETAAAAEAEAVLAAMSPEEREAAEAEAAEAAAAVAAMTPEEKEAAEKKVADDAAAEAAAKADPINDPIPESTKAETATRIKALIDIAKDTTQRADSGDEIVARITDTGADPDQYANTLGFLTLYNSTDPAQRKQALAAAEGVVRELRIELGEGTVELLANHEDLQAKVEAGTLAQEDAVEIAVGREKKILSDARTDAANTQTANDEQTQANIDAGKAQLTTLESTLRASDADYARLRPTFIALLRPALRKAHASDWGEVAQEIYVAVKTANPKPAVVDKPLPKNTPLRPKSSGGGSDSKESGPDTALEALNTALGSM